MDTKQNTKQNNNTAKPYTYALVGVPSRSWRYGHRCELRIHAADVDPRGRGYHDRCVEVIEDLDSRHRGPRSRCGQAIAYADELIAELSAK